MHAGGGSKQSFSTSMGGLHCHSLARHRETEQQLNTALERVYELQARLVPSSQKEALGVGEASTKGICSCSFEKATAAVLAAKRAQNRPGGYAWSDSSRPESKGGPLNQRQQLVGASPWEQARNNAPFGSATGPSTAMVFQASTAKLLEKVFNSDPTVLGEADPAQKAKREKLKQYAKKWSDDTTDAVRLQEVKSALHSRSDSATARTPTPSLRNARATLEQHERQVFDAFAALVPAAQKRVLRDLLALTHGVHHLRLPPMRSSELAGSQTGAWSTSGIAAPPAARVSASVSRSSPLCPSTPQTERAATTPDDGPDEDFLGRALVRLNRLLDD